MRHSWRDAPQLTVIQSLKQASTAQGTPLAPQGRTSVAGSAHTPAPVTSLLTASCHSVSHGVTMSTIPSFLLLPRAVHTRSDADGKKDFSAVIAGFRALADARGSESPNNGGHCKSPKPATASFLVLPIRSSWTLLRWRYQDLESSSGCDGACSLSTTHTEFVEQTRRLR